MTWEPVFQQVVVHLLDWPLLVVLGLLVIITVFREQLGKALEKDLTIRWGGRHIKIKNLERGVAQETEPIQDDVDGLRRRIEALETRLGTGQTADQDTEQIRTRMLTELANGYFTWRSIERLAAAAGVSQDEAARILRSTPQVRLARGRSGRIIATTLSTVDGPDGPE